MNKRSKKNQPCVCVCVCVRFAKKSEYLPMLYDCIIGIINGFLNIKTIYWVTLNQNIPITYHEILDLQNGYIQFNTPKPEIQLVSDDESTDFGE